MTSIAEIISRLDTAGQGFTVEALGGVLKPEWIEEALECTGRQSQRERLLPAPLALWMVLLLALFRRHSYVNLLGLLSGSLWAQQHWPSGRPPSSSAVSQARDRLGPEPPRVLFERSASSFLAEIAGTRLAGLRLMSMDGSTARTPDSTVNREHFGTQRCSRGRSAYPMLRVVTLVDIGSRLTVGIRHGTYDTGEMTLARSLVPDVPSDALLVLDRNFTAQDFLWDLRQRGVHFIVRVKRNMTGPTVRRLGAQERLVRVRFSTNARARRSDLLRHWILREVTYCPKPGHEAIRVFTSLLDPSTVSAAEVASAYGSRWEHETTLDEVKTHLMDRTTANRPVLFRSMTPERVVQELYGVLLAHNVVRVLLHRAAHAAGKSPDRLSFVAGLERIREAIHEMMRMATPRLTERYRRLLASLSWATVPRRPGRSNPRVVKIKMSHYLCKKPRHAA